jgi:hypothetical protein
MMIVQFNDLRPNITASCESMTELQRRWKMRFSLLADREPDGADQRDQMSSRPMYM